jgi:DNA-directed RNA polymerase specialized sigma24 family protein
MDAVAVPSSENIVLLSSWPQSMFSANKDTQQVCLRNEFGRIAEADWEHLYLVAIRAGAREQEAEDLVQVVLLRAFSALSGMDDNRPAHLNVHSWLTALVRKIASRSCKGNRVHG